MVDALLLVNVNVILDLRVMTVVSELVHLLLMLTVVMSCVLVTEFAIHLLVASVIEDGLDLIVLRLFVRTIVSSKVFAVQAYVSVRSVSPALIVAKRLVLMIALVWESARMENAFVISDTVDLTAARRYVPMRAATTVFARSAWAVFVTMAGRVLIVPQRIVRGIALATEFAIMELVVAMTIGLERTVLGKRVLDFALVVASVMGTQERVNVSESGWVLTARFRGTTRIPIVPRSVPISVWTTAKECSFKECRKDVHAI